MSSSSEIRTFLKKSAVVIAVISLELLIFVLFKDGAGTYSRDSGQTITGFLRTNGDLQFLFAAHIQKVFIFGFIAYLLIVILMVGRGMRDPYFFSSLNQIEVSRFTIIANAISFLILFGLFIFIRNPEELVAHPHSFNSLVYTLNPLVWVVYLLSTCDLLFSIRRLRRLITNYYLLVFAVGLIAIMLGNPELLNYFTDFWSSILLAPTIEIASLISRLLGFHYQVLPELVDGFPVFGTSQFSVAIAPACSGYEGMTLIMMLLGLYCFAQRDDLKMIRALLIFPIAGVAMFLLNAFRIFVLVAIGHLWSPEVALAGFHSVAGWLNLLVVFLACLFALNFIPYFQRAEKVSQPFDFGSKVLLLPLVTLIVSSLICRALTADFFWLYPAPIFLATWVLYLFRKSFLVFWQRPSALSLGVGILVFVLWIFLIPEDPLQSADFFAQLNMAAPWLAICWLLIRVIGATIVVPIAEEFAFRGFIQPKLQSWLEQRGLKSISIIASLLATSLLFGYVHSNILAGSIAGLLYGLVYLYRRQLIDAVIAHAITNGLLALYVIAFGYWSYW